MGRQFGWRSGVLYCKEIRCRGDVFVQDDIIFRDVTAGRLGVTGGIDMSLTTSTIGIDMGGTFATAAINIDGTIGKAINVDTDSTTGPIIDVGYQAATTLTGASQGLVLNMNTGVTPGAQVIKGIDLDIPQTTGSSTGIELTAGQKAGYGINIMNSSQTLTGSLLGIQIYLEGVVHGGQSIKGLQMLIPVTTDLYTQCYRTTSKQTMGEIFWTDTRQTLGEIFYAAWGAATTLAGAMTGIKLDMATNVTHGSQTMIGLEIDMPSGSTSTGIDIGIAQTGLKISGATTDGILVSGTCGDNALEITGVCSDSAIDVNTGGFVTGIKLDADGTTGIDITSNFTGTTGLLLAGTASNQISITGTSTVAGINIGGDNTIGINIAAQTTSALNISGATATGIVISGATDTGIHLLTGAFTTGLSIDADGVTAIAVTNSFSGTTMLSLAGTGTDGINISGICGDAIEISAAATTTGLNVSADCVTGITIGAQTTAGMSIGNTATGIDLSGDTTTGMVISGTYTTGILVSGAGTDGIKITGACTSAQLEISGTAILASGEQAIYINCPAETTATNGIWGTVKSTVATGDISGIRFKAETLRGTSGGPTIRCIRGQAVADTASMYAVLLCGGQFEASYAGGTTTATEIFGVNAHISQGSGLTATNVVGVNVNIQTRGDESITCHTGLRIRNEGVGGNGLALAQGAIYVTEASLGGGVVGYECLMDASTATLTDQTGNVVNLIKFVDSGGTARVIQYDSDAAAVLSVTTL